MKQNVPRWQSAVALLVASITAFLYLDWGISPPQLTHQPTFDATANSTVMPSPRGNLWDGSPWTHAQFSNISALLFLSAHQGCEHIPPFLASLLKSDFNGKVVVVVPLFESMTHCEKILHMVGDASKEAPSIKIELFHHPFPMRAETQSVYSGANSYIQQQRATEKYFAFLGVMFPDDVLLCSNPFRDVPRGGGKGSGGGNGGMSVFGVRVSQSSRRGRTRAARPAADGSSLASTYPLHSIVVGHFEAMKIFLSEVAERCNMLGLNTRVADCFQGTSSRSDHRRVIHRQLGSRRQYTSTLSTGCDKFLPLPLSCRHTPEVCVAVSISVNCAASPQQRQVPNEPCRSKFTRPFYILPPDTLQLAEATSSAVSVENRALVASWRKWQSSSPPSISDAKAMRSNRCDAVLSIAAGYSPAKVMLFIRSFLASVDESTVLVLFVSDAAAYAQALGGNVTTAAGRPNGQARVELVDVAQLMPLVKLAQHCGPAEYRFELLAVWLTSPPPPSQLSNGEQKSGGGGGKRRNVDRFDYLLLIDSRDAFFQADPFSALRADFVPSVAATTDSPSPSQLDRPRDFVVDIAEAFYAGSEDLILSVVYGKNQEWLKTVCGKSCFVHVTERTLGSGGGSNLTLSPLGGEAMPFVNSGQVLGSAQGMLDLFVLMSDSMHSGWDDRRSCLPDQAVMMLLFAGGFSVARFPHLVGFLTAERSRFRNLAASPSHLRWNENRRLVNCNGEVYAVVHQLDRHPNLLQVAASNFGL